MRVILAIVFVMLFCGIANASPYLVSDNSTETSVDSCKIEGDGFTLPCVLNAHKGINIDIASLTRGRSYTITAKYCAGVWCSDSSSPFLFTAPLTPKPLNIQLSK